MGQWAQMLRSSFAKGDEERDRGLTTPDNIIRYDDIRYDDPSTEDMMRGLMGDYLPEGGTPQERERISPVNYITAEYPPVFLMSSAADFLKGQAPVMAAALTRNNVPFCYRFYGSSSNQLPHVFHLDIRSEDARICNDEEGAFFREILEKENSSTANGVPDPE